MKLIYKGAYKMANITERKNKDGKVNAYLIKVYRGRDAQGKQLKPYVMTWNPPDGWTKRSIDKEVQKQAALFEDNCKKGNISTEKQTFEAYARYVLDLKERTGAKHRTIFRYKSLLERVIDIDNCGIGYIKLQDIRADHLNKLYSKLAEPGQNHTEANKGLSAKTIIEHHRLISTVLSQAVKEQMIPFNMAERATPPRLPRHEAECFDTEQIREIIKAAETEPLKWKAATHLFISTGARRGEVLGIRWNDVDFLNNQIYLCNNLLYSPEKGIYNTTLKTGENRYVTVAAEVIEILKEWRKEQNVNRFKLGMNWQDGDYIFTQEDGSPMHPDSVTDWFTKFSKRYSLPKIYPHKFRHSQASILINAGVDIVTVSKRLGHAKVSTTSDIYSHILAKADERASNAIAEILYKKA